MSPQPQIARSLKHKGVGLVVLKGINAALGLGLSLCLAAVFGVSSRMDALFIALFVAVVIGRELAQMVRTALIPCIVEDHEYGSDPDALDALRTGPLLAAVLLAALVWAGAPWLVRAISPGFSPETAHVCTSLLRVLAPTMILHVLVGIAGGFFNAARHFYVPETAAIIWRLAALVGLFTLGRQAGVEGYAVGLCIATFLQWTMLWVAGHARGLSVLPLRPHRLRWSALALFWKGVRASASGVLLRKVDASADRMASSLVGEGAVALFSYAYRLVQMVPAVLAFSFFQPFYPELARARTRSRDVFALGRQIALMLLVLGLPIALMLARVAGDLVQAQPLRGILSVDAGMTVARAMQALALGVPAMFCIQGLKGPRLVLRDSREIVRQSVVTLLTHIAGIVALFRYGVPGIALAGSLGFWAGAIYLWWRSRTTAPVVFGILRVGLGTGLLLLVLFGVPWAQITPVAWVRIVVAPTVAGVLYIIPVLPLLNRMRRALREGMGEASATPTSHAP